MPKPQTATKIKQLAFSENLINTANQKSDLLGITFAEYMRYLVVRDNEAVFSGIITYPANLPKEIEAEYDKDIKELEEQIKQGKAKEYSNIQDLIKDLDTD